MYTIDIYGHKDIYGNKYDTKDGTGVRDYIHVTDLANAHIKAFEYLYEKDKDLVVNLGTGFGHSVLEVINQAIVISGENINYQFSDPRDGDPSRTIADATFAKKVLKWEAKYSDLKTIINTTWECYKSRL